MARIRDYQGENRAASELPNTRANPNDFGAQIGGALQGAGDTLGQAALMVRESQERKDGIEADLLAAKVQQTFTKHYYDLQTTSQPGAKDFHATVGNSYDAVAGQYTEGVSEGVKKKAQLKLENLKTSFLGQAAGFEAQAGAALTRNNAADALATFQNLTTLDPTTYEANVASSIELIDKLAPGEHTPGVPEDLRNEMKRTTIEKLTGDYFSGRIDRAKSAADIDAVLTEMADEKFATRLDPKNTSALVNNARAMKTTIASANKAKATAAIATIKDRLDAGVKIDALELDAADKAVREAGDPAQTNEYMTMRTRHEALAQGRTMSKAAVDEAVTNENGLPTRQGTTNYAGFPAELNAGIGEAVQVTGGKVSSDYLARTLVRESGVDIAKLRRGKEEFAPKGLAGVNIDGMKPAVRDAAAVAGEIFGEPLTLNSGYRSQAKQDAIRGGRNTPLVAKHSHHTEGTALDIDTSGWAPERKAKLVDALVQAGFTGFGEYDNHVHADMRGNVPSSFDAKQQFGGWTRLSPAVMDTLVKRGFRSGENAGKVDRMGADGKQFASGPLNFDFSNETSSARGPTQMLKGTWLEALPRAVERLGLELPPAAKAELEKLRLNPTINGAPNADDFPELLKLRADPKLSLKVFADYSLVNKKILEANLKRNVNDSELYMAHLMGPTGATNFLKAFAVQPDALVSDVLSSKAIAANNKVFQIDGKAKTVSQVYYEIAGNFSGGVDQLAQERAKALHGVSKEMAALNETRGDPMTYASTHAGFRPAALTDASGFSVRGEQALQQAEYYKLDFPKPLTNDEISDYKKRIEEGPVSDAVNALREIGQFKGRAAEGASRQISEQSAVTAHLAGMVAQGGASPAVAEDVVRGMRRLADDKTSRDYLGGENGGTGRKFDAYVGNALDGLDPKSKSAAKTVADAYYVQKFAPRDGTFNDADYQKAIDATLAGRVGKVNGVQTILPAGVSPEEMDDAIDNIQQADLAALSVSGALPYDALGRQIQPYQVSVEGRFEHRGGNVYALKLGDNRYAITDQADSNGLPLPYLLTLDRETVVEMATRNPPARQASNGGSRFRPIGAQ